MDSASLIEKLETDGWYLDRMLGMHRQFRHPQKPGLITLKHSVADIPVRTLQLALRAAGCPENTGSDA